MDSLKIGRRGSGEIKFRGGVSLVEGFYRRSNVLFWLGIIFLIVLEKKFVILKFLRGS